VQLGAGLGSGYPAEIDTRQIFQNVPAAAPDSDTRLDSELANDTLETLVALETTLGANPQGSFASVAARLNFYFPDVGLPPNVVGFVNQTSVSVPGTVHQLGTAALVWSLWDASTPRHAIEPGSFSVSPASFDVLMLFNVLQSGTLILDAPPIRYEATFSGVSSVTVTGATHGLGTADLFWQLYDASNPRLAFLPQTLTVHPTTFDVVVTFSGTRTGRLILTPGRASYAQNFTGAISVPVAGSTHQLGSAALLWQLYDASTPRQAIAPGSLTVDPASFNVQLGFTTAQSGRLLLGAVAEPPTALAMTLAVPMGGSGRRVGPHDPLPVLMRTVQALEARLQALEESQTALLTHLTQPSPEEPAS